MLRLLLNFEWLEIFQLLSFLKGLIKLAGAES